VRALAFAAAASLLAGAACTGEERAQGRDAGDFRSAANRICARTFDGGRVRGRVLRTGLAAETARWDHGIDRLAALKPPARDARRFRTMLVHFRRMADAVRASAEAENERLLPKVIAGVVAGQRAGTIARDLGLDACVIAEPPRQPPRDPESPPDAAKALVPPGARVSRTLGCDAESCLLALDFGGIDAMDAAARNAFAANDWTAIRAGGPSVGSWVIASRNDLQATFQFPRRDRPPCDARREAPFCADTLWVHRVRVPQLPD
jgi:hypothetical protein